MTITTTSRVRSQRRLPVPVRELDTPNTYFVHVRAGSVKRAPQIQKALNEFRREIATLRAAS